MSDYIVTPHKKEIPSSHLLSEELHRRALSVEMEVKGTNYKWESIYFYDPITPETQCIVERNLHSLVYKVSLTPESTHESEELQHALVEILLHEVGGKVYEPENQKSSDLKTFQNRARSENSEVEIETTSSPSKKLPMTMPPVGEILWIVFAWALVGFGFYVYQQAPQDRKLFVLIACGLAFISAAGITFSKTKSK